MTEHPRNVRAQDDDIERMGVSEYMRRMLPVMRATVEVELMRKRALDLPISEAKEDLPSSGPLKRPE